MEALQLTDIDWVALSHDLGKDFENRAEAHDKNRTFVFDNYEQLKAHGYFSAAIPEQLGGGGLSHTEMCDIIRIMAHYSVQPPRPFQFTSI